MDDEILAIKNEISIVKEQIIEVKAILKHIDLTALHDKVIKFESYKVDSELSNLECRISALEKFKWQSTAIIALIAFSMPFVERFLPH